MWASNWHHFQVSAWWRHGFPCTNKPSPTFRRHTNGWCNSPLVKRRVSGNHLWPSEWALYFVQGDNVHVRRGAVIFTKCVRELLIKAQRVMMFDKLFLEKHDTHSLQISSSWQTQSPTQWNNIFRASYRNTGEGLLTEAEITQRQQHDESQCQRG